VGGVFGREKIYIQCRVIDYTYWALVYALGQWDGLQWMGLDDDVPIRKVLPFRDGPKKYLSVTSMYIHLFESFLSTRGRRNGWMGWDGFG